MTASPHFSTDLKRIARNLRAALSSLMVAAGLDPMDPQSLAREWGLNRQLSWKIVKVIQIDDAYVALQHLPGNEGLGILLKKAEQAGVAATVLDALKEAALAFDQLVDTHCGDRAVFDIMGSALSPAEPARQQQANLRKQFFLGASSIWGAQTKVNLVTWFVCPSEGEGPDARHVDLVSIKAWIGFRRLRENLPWVISRQMSRHDTGAWMPIPAPEALDPRSDPKVPLMRDFCSDPLPEISVREDDGRTISALAAGPVGTAGQVSCVLGKIHRRMPHFRSETDQFSKFMCDLNVPSELTIFDLFVHQSMAFAIPPRVTLSSLMEPRDPALDRSLLPLHEPLAELGVPSPAPLTLEVPRYQQMIDLVMARMGWAPEEFTGFRLRMNYPPLPAVLTMRYELPATS